MGKELVDFLKSRKKVNLLMVTINVVVFLVLSVMGNTESASFMAEHGAAWTPYILEGQYYRLFTSMFLHFGLVHLLYNMVCLIFLGDVLETMAGPVRYLVIYLVGGLAGNLLSVLWDMHTQEYAVSAGASGAIFAVIGAVFSILVIHRRKTGRMSVQRLGMVVVLMILQGFFEAGTDNVAHIGGLLAGIVIAAICCRHAGNAAVKR